MKKILAMLMVTSLYAGGLEIIKEVDEMTDEVSYRASKGLEFIEEGRGFVVSPWIKNDLTLRGLFVFSDGLGRCMEDDTLIFLLESGEKVKLKSFSSFNCRGSSFFELDESKIEALSLSPIKKVLFENGRTFDSMKVTAKGEKTTYLMDVIEKLRGKK